MLNRAAILLRYKEPAVRWINETSIARGHGSIPLAEANQERTVYLISDEEADTADTVERWVQANYLALFEAELEGWYTDVDLWPEDRSLEKFKEWFEVECHSMIVD